MKLLVICQYFYPEQFRVSDVCFKLAAMGHDITVLTGLPNYPAGEIFDGYKWDNLKKIDCNAFDSKGNFNVILGAYQEEMKHVKVIRSKLLPRKKGKLNLILNYISFAYYSSKVAKKIIRHSKCEFDKILVFQYSPITMAIPGLLLKKRMKKPLILYCFDLWPESIVSAGLPNHGILYNILLRISKWIYKKADMALISSKNFEKYFNEKLDIYENIKYLPIYAEDLFIQAINVSEKNAITSTDINLVFAGNIGEMQSMETIIMAANLLKDKNDIHFHIVGDGSALEKSMQLTKDFALKNITFHGRHPLKEMPGFYAMADAFLVTLKKDEMISYTLPGKVQSYMASAKPIIAAIDGETAEVIRESQCGLVCPAEDYKGLAEIILKFIEDKENRQKYGENSNAYYNANFSIEPFMESLLNIIN